MAKSPEEMTASMIENLQEKTGRSLEQWLAVVAGSKLPKHGDIVKHLTAEHGVTHGYANLIAHKALEAASAEPAKEGADLVTAQYAGGKAGFRPIYDRLIAVVQKFGSDVEVAPKKAYVSLRRSKQFALIQPSTATRHDVGIQLKSADATDRLEASGSFNSMVSHRVRVSQLSDIDSQLEKWLKQAYEAA